MAAKLTGPASRAARGLLKWSIRELADASGVSTPTIVKLEADDPIGEGTAEKLRSAFAAHGVEITNGDGTGARLRRP